MRPEEYERHVADLLGNEGWEAHGTPCVRDFGIDVIAERGGVRLGVQVKMFAGANRVVGSPEVLQTYAGAAYADCTEAMIATDSQLSPDARKAALKLGVQIRHVPVPVVHEPVTGVPGSALTFGSVWEDQIVPLAGRELQRANGSTNRIVSVDGGGLVRITSNGKRQEIKVEVFRWTIERLLRGEVVTREEINTNCIGRASSGVVLILSQLPLFETCQSDRGIALRLAPPLDPPHDGRAA